MRIVVPDDFPSIFAGSAAEEELRRLGAVKVFSERGADSEDEAGKNPAGEPAHGVTGPGEADRRRWRATRSP